MFKKLVVVALLLIGYGQLNAIEKEIGMQVVKTGGIELVKLENGYNVWTKRVGTGPIKILLLHGGPGCTHEYFECFEDFFPKDQFQLIYYDQLGSHYSDQPDDPSLWTLDRFCSEVEEVRKALKLENFYLCGQSWGGLLAIEYALKYQKHLKGLILSNITASVASYESYLDELRKQLPKEVQEDLAKFEKDSDFANAEYEKIMFEKVYTKYLCRLETWPEPLLRTFRHLNKQVYNTIQGPNEFIVVGNFKGWDRWKEISQIKTPTLLISGRFDTMNPKDIEKMGTLIPHSKVKICEKGSHLSMYDDQETYFKELHHFLKNVENQKSH